MQAAWGRKRGNEKINCTSSVPLKTGPHELWETVAAAAPRLVVEHGVISVFFPLESHFEEVECFYANFPSACLEPRFLHPRVRFSLPLRASSQPRLDRGALAYCAKHGATSVCELSFQMPFSTDWKVPKMEAVRLDCTRDELKSGSPHKFIISVRTLDERELER